MHIYIHMISELKNHVCVRVRLSLEPHRGLLPRVPFDLVKLVSLVHVYSPCYLPLSRAFHHNLAHTHMGIEKPQ